MLPIPKLVGLEGKRLKACFPLSRGWQEGGDGSCCSCHAMSRTSRPGTEREWLICFPQDSKKSKSNKSCGSHSSQALDLACGVLGWPWQLISSLGPSGAGNGTCPRQLFLKWENSWFAWLWELITEWTKAIVSDIALFLDNVCVQSRPSWNFKKHGMTGEYLRSFEVVDYFFFFRFSPQWDTSTLLT